MTAPTEAQRLRSAEIEYRALSLRSSGKDYAEIAGLMGISPEMAAKAVRRALARQRRESRELAADVRDMELARLDTMLNHAMCIFLARRGADINKPGGLIIQIMERRSKLLGLDAPAKSAIFETGDPLKFAAVGDAELDEIEAILNKGGAAPLGEDNDFEAYEGAADPEAVRLMHEISKAEAAANALDKGSGT